MRPIKRIDNFCDELKEIWKQFPDLRFGQLMVIFMKQIGDPFYLEDDQFIEKLVEFAESIKPKNYE